MTTIEKLRITQENILSNNSCEKDITKFKINCKKFISDKNNTLTQLMDIFNNLMLENIKQLLNDIPNNNDLITLQKGIGRIIFINKSEPISMFIKHIYADDDYRISLKTSNDSFFMNTSSEDIAKKHSSSFLIDEETINNFFNFKKYWSIIQPETQTNIKSIMVSAVDIVEKYLEIKDDNNDVIKMLIKVDEI
jgi:hypothetical protein